MSETLKSIIRIETILEDCRLGLLSLTESAQEGLRDDLRALREELNNPQLPPDPEAA